MRIAARSKVREAEQNSETQNVVVAGWLRPRPGRWGQWSGEVVAGVPGVSEDIATRGRVDCVAADVILG